MIFVTVGAQMPFDRLVSAVDQWASIRGDLEVFAQIGPTDYRPRHIEAVQFLEPPEFRRRVQSAVLVVAHAGMGSIITALELGKPIIVMPRHGDLGETRNDHQIATARRFAAMGRVVAAFDKEQLFAALQQAEQLRASDPIKRQASPQLIEAIRNFIDEETNLLRPHRDWVLPSRLFARRWARSG
jgi:UDP-N-acetylglucosamine transferase subunit ALG13